MKKYLSDNYRTLHAKEQIDGVKVGRIINVDKSGQILVDFPGNEQGPVTARFISSVKLEALRQASSSNQDILLVFENNDPLRPVIIDTISSLINEIVQTEDIDLKVDEPKDVTIDGEKITFDAKEQITLKCGQSSITLTRSGKVLIRGAYLLSRSTGVNSIKGGSVQIN